MFSNLRKIVGVFSPREKKAVLAALIVFIFGMLFRGSLEVREKSGFVPVEGGTWKEGLIGQPVAINPVISQNQVDKDLSALVYAPLEKLVAAQEVDAGRKIYSLKLKEGLRWSDGAPLTSDDVIFTIRTIQNPETRSPLFKNWQGVAVERISELQIQITIPSPYIFFQNNFLELPIIPRHAFGLIPAANIRLSSYNLEPIGSGPYVFKGMAKRKDGFIEEMRFVKNEFFAGERPFIKNFSFRFFYSEDDAQKAFQLRQIKGFGSLGPMTINRDKIPRASVEKIKMPRYYALFWNPSVNPMFKNSELREGLSLAIDRERIIREVAPETGEIVDGPIFQTDAEENIPAYNPEEAQKKIAALKQKSIELSIVVPSVDFLIKSAEIIKENWLSVGIAQVNIIALNPEDLVNNVIRSRNYEVVIFGNVLENKFDVFPFWHSSQRFYPGLNLSLYQNNAVDQNIERVRQEPGDLDRESILREIGSQIRKDSPAAFLFALPYTYVHSKNLGGATFDKYISDPSKRFADVEKWHLLKVRLLR